MADEEHVEATEPQGAATPDMPKPAGPIPAEFALTEEPLAEGQGRPAAREEMLGLSLERAELRLPVPELGEGVFITITRPVAASELGQIYQKIDAALRERNPFLLAKHEGKPAVHVQLSEEILTRYVWLAETNSLADGAKLSLEDIVRIGERTGSLMPMLALRAAEHCLALGEGIARAKADSGGASPNTTPPETETQTASDTGPGTSSGSPEPITEGSSPAPA